MDRIKTGIEQLDEILCGGFPAASTTIIAGGPGTGKTMLAQEIAYRHAAANGKVLYLTTVSEPMHKMLRHVQDFPFFDSAKVGSMVKYEDLGALIQQGNVEEVMDLIADLVQREAPKILIVDSFKALTDLAGDLPAFRRALYRLGGRLSASGCTAFLLGEYAAAELATLPEFAVADGIVELTNERRGIRTYRYLSVAKLRGSDFQDGRHALHLTRKGLQLYPRFRTPSTPATYAISRNRIATGVPNLDAALGGGILAGSATLVVGPTGTGKTLVALSLACAASARGEKVVFTSFQEDPNQIAEIASNYGLDVTKGQENGTLSLLYVSPVELDLDQHVLKMVEALERTKAAILVVDSVSDLEKGAYDTDRFSAYMFSLIQYAKDRQVALLMTLEANKEFAESAFTESGVSRIADNVLFFSDARVGDSVRRELRILKTRGSHHDHDVHVVTISETGMRIEARAETPGAGLPKRRGG